MTPVAAASIDVLSQPPGGVLDVTFGDLAYVAAALFIVAATIWIVKALR